MLQALFKQKLKEAFRDSTFEPSEDSKTSSVFGLLQYLPAQTMWDLLRQSCSDYSSLGEISGELQDIQFWTRWSAKGDDISNLRDVEPDVFCEFENFDLIVEAKKDDQTGQYEQQWINEISAYMNEYADNKKALIFIAFGGNKTFESKKIYIKGREYFVHLASWQNLLNAIDNHKKKCSILEQKRILSDIIRAFEKHNFFCLEWLENLGEFYKNNISNINIDSKIILKLWQSH